MSDVRWRKTALVIVLLLAALCLADGDDGFDENPILIKQPAFACSLPVQILLNGIVLALTAVLLFHLLFTAQYHYPLAPLNYLLQLAGVLSLLISLIATLYVVLTSSLKDSREWPYMLTYLAKDVPPSSTNATDLVYAPTPWTTAELAAWYAMAATTSGLVQITHIQFLTLLYPSKLERNLILCLLGPLALLSAAMELLPIHQSQTIVDIASTIRNTCNAALSLLFTSALFLYGLLVNRTQAWRTDGGTAVFGSAALALALISTALNFLYIPTKDRYLWLPSLIWAVVLWQSFLGWWWWVGGGRGVSEVEELLEREERRERKRKARERKRVERKEKAQALWKNASENLTMHFGRKGSVVYRHSTAGHHNVMSDSTNNSNSSNNSNNNSKEINGTGDGVETSTTTLHDEGAHRANSGNHNQRQRIPGPTPSETGSTSFSNTSSPSHTSTSTGTSASTQSGIFSRLLSSPPLLALSHFYHLLRRAHLAAAHSQALERMRKRREVYRRELGGTDVTAAVSVGADISATAASSIGATGADTGEKASDFGGAGVSAGTGGVDKKGNASKAKNKNNTRYRRRHVPHSLGSNVGVGVGIDTSTGDGIGARRVVDEPNVVGWGLGSFGLRRERRDAENLFARSRALRGMGAGAGTGVEMERTETFMSASSGSSSVGSIRSVDSAATVIATGADLGLDADPELGRTSTSVRGLRGRGSGRSGRGNGYSSSGYGRGNTGNARGKRWRRRERGLARGVGGEDEEENSLEGDEEELESVDGERNEGDYGYGEENEVDLEEPIQDRTRPRSHPRTHPVVHDNVLRGGEHTRAEGGGWSPWWWGPMRRWRLQDSTVYS